MAEDYDIDDLVDVIEGSRVYIPAIYVVNKIDQVCPGVKAAPMHTRELSLQHAVLCSSDLRDLRTAPTLKVQSLLVAYWHRSRLKSWR